MSRKIKNTATQEEATPALVPKLRFPEFRNGPSWAAKPMGEAYSFKGNNSLSRDQLNYEHGSVKNIHYGDIHTKFSTLFDITKERVPFINPAESLDGFRPENECLEGDMIFADASEDLEDIGKSIEVVRLNGERVFSGQHKILARPSGDGLVIGFGAYLFKSRHVRTQIQKESQGSKVLGISATRLTKIKLPIPSTKPEQKKIAECLSSVDELIAAQARKLDALKTHKKGLMQQLFPREGETQPRLRFPEFQNAGEWVGSELGSLSDVRDGTHDSPSFFPTGRPLVTSKNLRSDGTLDLENVSLISEEDFEQINKRSKVKVGDILFGMIGTIGNPVRIKSEGFAIKNVALIKEVGPLLNTFVVQLLQSGYVAAIFAVLNTGNSQKFIALGKIRGLPVPVPSLPEQQRIADCLTSLDDLIAAQTQKHEALKTHKKGLMQQLFPSPEEVAA
jgi:type I restriction enzyme, S subunit